jgi:DUF4097 and DUF4098 domain-containing protein YvlB
MAGMLARREPGAPDARSLVVVAEQAAGTPGALRLNITSRSGRVHVRAEPGAALEVDGGSATTEPDGSVRIEAARHGSSRLSVRCPTGSDVVVGAASGRVELEGTFGDVRVATRSSRIEVDHAARVDARSTSGSVRIGACDGDCRVVVRSGSARVGRAGSVEVSGLSGSIEAASTGRAQVRSVSGRVQLATEGAGDVEVRTVSASVDIEVDPERRPAARLRSLSGSVRCDCPPGDDGRIDVETTSGSIRVRCR